MTKNNRGKDITKAEKSTQNKDLFPQTFSGPGRYVPPWSKEVGKMDSKKEDPKDSRKV